MTTHISRQRLECDSKPSTDRVRVTLRAVDNYFRLFVDVNDEYTKRNKTYKKVATLSCWGLGEAKAFCIWLAMRYHSKKHFEASDSVSVRFVMQHELDFVEPFDTDLHILLYQFRCHKPSRMLESTDLLAFYCDTYPNEFEYLMEELPREWSYSEEELCRRLREKC